MSLAHRDGRFDVQTNAHGRKLFAGCTVFALGHSTRTQEELVELLFAHGIATLADIRTVPRSRTNPQFNRDVLGKLMPRVGIRYLHLALLGGLRKTVGAASPNQAWRNLSFRGYADYMQTPAFEDGLAELRALCAEGPTAVMCAEGNRWRCHRSLLADAIVARGGKVRHIVSWRRSVEHVVTPFARVRAGKVTYPA